MRTMLIALLMTLATQMGAGQLMTTVSTLLNDAKVKLGQQKFTWPIDGLSLATEYMFSPDWRLTYKHVSGNGHLSGTPSDFNFNHNLFYTYHAFAEDNFLFLNWRLNYKIGVGPHQKKPLINRSGVSSLRRVVDLG